MFSVNTSYLDIILVCNLFEDIHVLRKLWQSDVNRCSQCSTQISWAGCDITKMFIVCELNSLLDVSTSSSKSFENSTNVATFLHRNDSKLIFFIDPHKESQFVIMEDASSLWPVSVQASSFQESIAFFE